MIVLKNVLEISASKVLMNTKGFLGHHIFLKNIWFCQKTYGIFSLQMITNWSEDSRIREYHPKTFQ